MKEEWAPYIVKDKDGETKTMFARGENPSIEDMVDSWTVARMLNAAEEKACYYGDFKTLQELLDLENPYPIIREEEKS